LKGEIWEEWALTYGRNGPSERIKKHLLQIDLDPNGEEGAFELIELEGAGAIRVPLRKDRPQVAHAAEVLRTELVWRWWRWLATLAVQELVKEGWAERAERRRTGSWASQRASQTGSVMRRLQAWHEGRRGDDGC
tara:strand:- start:132 stop:536 length:405 start_codon:yes stop_codon:yes gene_type:complete